MDFMGTMNGQPAKIVHHPERAQTHIYWGGIGRPDGPLHHHARIQDKDGHLHFLRVNGVVVIDDRYPATGEDARRRLKAGMSFAEILRDAWERNRRWWNMQQPGYRPEHVCMQACIANKNCSSL